MRGSAAVEMALVMPLLLVIMFGSVEVGNYFYNEHMLVKGVRDGARFAARQAFTNYAGCTSTPSDVGDPVASNTKLVVRKGSLDSTDPDLLPKWDDGAASFSVKVACSATSGTTTWSGIYTNVVGGAPVVTVRASLPYRSLLGSFGFTGEGFSLSASQQSAVSGI